MWNNIPDLRAHIDDFTLEHCSVLLERLGRELDKIYDEDDGFVDIATHVDPEQMRDDLLSLMSVKQLSTLFNSDLGKGIIVGIFFTEFILSQEME